MLRPIEVDHVFSATECQRIVSIAHANDFRDAAIIGSMQSPASRLLQTSWLNEKGAADWIFKRLLATFAKTNRDHFDFKLDEFAECMKIAWYDAASGEFFDWHIDVGASALAIRRKLTMVVQLSEPESYVGGQLETNADGNIRVASRCVGSALVLPSFMLHRVSPVTFGSRYSLTLWSHGPAFR